MHTWNDFTVELGGGRTGCTAAGRRRRARSTTDAAVAGGSHRQSISLWRSSAQDAFLGSAIAQKPPWPRCRCPISKCWHMRGSHHDDGCWMMCALRPSGRRLHRRAGVNGEKPDVLRDIFQVEEYCFQVALLDVFEHVDAADELRGLRRTIFRERRVVRGNIRRVHACRRSCNALRRLHLPAP